MGGKLETEEKLETGRGGSWRLREGGEVAANNLSSGSPWEIPG